MDGSAPGYYIYRTSSSTRWVINLQGGGLCTSARDCHNFIARGSGTSVGWSCAIPQPGMDDEASTTTSSDSRRNPYFLNWNRVVVPYCSGDLYSGRRPMAMNPWNVSFTGHYIIKAIIQDLIDNHGINSATHVLIGGQSAGSVGTIANLDSVTSQLRQSNPNVKISAYWDYWLRLYPSYAAFIQNPNASVYSNTSEWRGQAALLSFENGYVNKACKTAVTQNSPNLGGLECLDPTWAGQYVPKDVSVLVLAPRWDTYSLRNFQLGNQLYSCLQGNGSLSSQEAEYMKSVGNDMYSSAQTLNAQPAVSVYLANCFTHTLLGTSRLCTGVNGVSPYQALVSFVQRTLLATTSKESWIDVTPFDTWRLTCTAGCYASECIWSSTALRTSGMCSLSGGMGRNSSSSGSFQRCNRFDEPRANTPSLKLVKYQVADAVQRKAICLDGSPSAYYVQRNYSNTKWTISMEGGAFCSSRQSCQDRANNRLGSTINWSCLLPGADSGGGSYRTEHSPASADKARNPTFYTWNRVYIRYCTGDLYLGRQLNNSFGVNTVGFYVVNAIFDDLLKYHDLANATTVLIGGSSAGGIGSFTLLDLLNDSINKKSGNRTKVYGFNDGGWFRAFTPYNEYLANPSIATNNEVSPYALALGHIFGNIYNIYSHPGCLSQRLAAKSRLGGADCILTELTAPYVKTPYYVLGSRWDTYDLYLKFGSLYGCSSYLGSLPARARDYVRFYSNYTQNTISKIMPGSGNSGLFMPNCYKHTSFGFDLKTNTGPACGAFNGITPYEALTRWFNAMEKGTPNSGPASSYIEAMPSDSQGLACNSQCGAKQCSWATNLDGNNGSCLNIPPSRQGYTLNSIGVLCPNIPGFQFASPPTEASPTTFTSRSAAAHHGNAQLSVLAVVIFVSLFHGFVLV